MPYTLDSRSCLSLSQFLGKGTEPSRMCLMSALRQRHSMWFPLYLEFIRGVVASLSPRSIVSSTFLQLQDLSNV